MTADVQRELAEALTDELSGWPIGSGYYATAVGSDDARKMVEALLPLIADAEKRAAAAALESAAREDSVSTHRFTPVEMLTLRVVRVDALLTRAAALDPSGAADAPAPHDRYAQCDDTCTVDCGACKGGGPR